MLVGRKVQCQMERSCLKTTGFVVLVLWLGCATARGNGSHIDMKRDQDFFLRQIFDKYGDNGVITFEVKTLSDVRTGNSYVRFVEGEFDWVKESHGIRERRPGQNHFAISQHPFCLQQYSLQDSALAGCLAVWTGQFLRSR
jgi:hypothetical protein